MQALLPFLKPEMNGYFLATKPASVGKLPSGITTAGTHVYRILIVDDCNGVRQFCRIVLQSDEIKCDEAVDGMTALEMLKENDYDLALVDIDMPGLSGYDVLSRLREEPPSPNLKVILFSGRVSADELARVMAEGADDYLTKPFSVVQLQSRVKATLHLRGAQQRSDLLLDHLLSANRELERNLAARDSDVILTRNVLVMALTDLVRRRDEEAGGHLSRMQRDCRRIAEEAARIDGRRLQIDAEYIDMLECCVPMHDIGNIALPDELVKKPGKLNIEERLIMQRHTTLGAEAVQETAKKYNLQGAFVQMAVEVIRHHHERYDGRGYPNHLTGDLIPLSARIVAIADVYDALRSRKPFRPSLSHSSALQVMLGQCEGQFDPFLLRVFERLADEFEQIYAEIKN